MELEVPGKPRKNRRLEHQRGRYVVEDDYDVSVG